MTVNVSLFSDLCIGKCYKLITFGHGVRMSEIMLGKINQDHIKHAEPLGKLIEIKQVGRPYDPDFILRFQQENGLIVGFEPSLGLAEAYLEYEPDTEEMSRKRIQERVSVIAQEIQGNDWAFRPENVVATQGIDTSHFQK